MGVGKDDDLALRLRQPRLRAPATPNCSAVRMRCTFSIGFSSKKSEQPSVEPLSTTMTSLSGGSVAANCSTVRCNKTDSLEAGKITLILRG